MTALLAVLAVGILLAAGTAVVLALRLGGLRADHRIALEAHTRQVAQNRRERDAHMRTVEDLSKEIRNLEEELVRAGIPGTARSRLASVLDRAERMLSEAETDPGLLDHGVVPDDGSS